MNKRIFKRSALALALGLASSWAMAGVSADEAAKLGKELTPVGAERAGNADGSIPEWKPAAQRGAKKGVFPNNPDIDGEKPLFTITAANMGQYEGKLTEGHKELLKRYPNSYKMNVYPSHRFANFPQKILDETIKNATRASIDGVDNPRGAFVGFPFPIPKTGAEPIWNHRVKYRGSDLRRYNNQMIVQQDGKFSLTKIVEDVTFNYANLDKNPPDELKPGTEFLRYLSETLSPPRIAGTYILVHEKAGFGPEGRSAWLYLPALKRIRRAPAVCCDNPYEGTDGHQFYDQVDMYNGVLERFTWKLVGKREMYIPYNANGMVSPKVKYADLAKPNHLNTDLPRYELHRVWVVEADNKPETRHTFKKRRLYIDEDTWNVIAIDDYDHQDKLMQFQEGHLVIYYNMLSATTQPEVIYHLNSGRYFVTALINEDEPYDSTVSYPANFFEANTVQKRTSK
ncbi:DUF1329 domain-containing protein [Sinimarinibacterium sp. NLF-5-8]|uniref:DUF1329 domain-containing protein n=1 Tax=Sinimarinibacterium sp. NLF-5-8 TaxID=2698684 RepID=UPI00137C0D3B|nr:DUF1329 domain-containing protein [Sinimarinibacterium sp. NLF-5-8]QHS10454.1 DUF1329 domain-containing protein [Sinimarinibacterium sp. NLF-5-8]